MTAADATQAGFHPLTSGFHPRTEAALLDAVKRDMERGRIPYALIEETPGRFSVWRKGWVERPNPHRSVAKGIRG